MKGFTLVELLVVMVFSFVLMVVIALGGVAIYYLSPESSVCDSVCDAGTVCRDVEGKALCSVLGDGGE